MYAPYTCHTEVISIKHVTRSTVYTFLASYILCYWHKSLNTYGYHIANIGLTALNLYRHIGLTMCVYLPNISQMQHLLHKLFPYMLHKLMTYHTSHEPYVPFTCTGMWHYIASFNHMNRNTTHILQTTFHIIGINHWTKKTCQTVNTYLTVCNLYRYTDPILKHVCAKHNLV